MKMVTAHVYLQSYKSLHGLHRPEILITLNEVKDQTAQSSFVYKKLCESQIAVPDLTDSENEKLMAGAELESLLAEKERLKAETHRKLMQMDDRISQLTAIEDKR